MSRSITVCHGIFGRISLTECKRAKVLHATREGQLLFLVSGENVTVRINGEDVILSRDRAVAIDSFSAHEIPKIDSSNPAKILSVCLDPMWFATRNSDSDIHWLKFDAHSITVSAEIEHHLENLLTFAEQSLPANQHEFHSAVEKRISLLSKACFGDSVETMAPCAQPSNPMTTCDSRIRKSLAIMHNHIRGNLCLDEIARAAGLSRPHFYRLFRDNLGFTPNIYMNLLRMEFAIERLTRSNQPVTSIALDLGFASQASFTRFFGANQGIPPTDYRRLSCIPPALPADTTTPAEIDSVGISQLHSVRVA